MINNNKEKQIPKTMTIDVNEQSWSKGYDVGYNEGCPQITRPTYLGYPMSYWGDLVANYAPLGLFFVLIMLFARRQRKQYLNKYETSLERQKQSVDLQEKAIQLLTEISQKLDKK